MTSSPSFQLIPLPYPDTEERCRTCGKRLCLDVGGGVFGDIDGLLFCLHCDPLTPETSWALTPLPEGPT